MHVAAREETGSENGGGGVGGLFAVKVKVFCKCRPVRKLALKSQLVVLWR